MDFKKIIPSRSVRLGILRALNFVPDEPMLRFQYLLRTGHRLDLKDPRRFTEKMQWYKLHYHDPRMITCVDKYDVRSYVKEKGLERILIPCHGVYDAAEDIDWEALPERFVMKDTLGSGGHSVLIVNDKEAADREELMRQAAAWTRRNPRGKTAGREWPYYSGKAHRIIIEDNIAPRGGESLRDYKFFCFNGRVEFVYVMGDRQVGQSVRVSIYDRDLRLLPVRRVGDAPYEAADLPDNYPEMRAVAEKLAEDFPHVRVDLYNVDGQIRFGELTFYNASGYMQFDPDSFDLEIGDRWDISNLS